MIAVVDAAAEFTIEIRPAAPSGGRPGFIDRGGVSGVGQRHRGGQPGEAAADHMRDAHTSPKRSASQSFCHFGRLTRSSSRAQPRSSMRVSSAS